MAFTAGTRMSTSGRYPIRRAEAFLESEIDRQSEALCEVAKTLEDHLLAESTVRYCTDHASVGLSDVRFWSVMQARRD